MTRRKRSSTDVPASNVGLGSIARSSPLAAIPRLPLRLIQPGTAFAKKLKALGGELQR